MVSRKTTLPAALIASLAVALPAVAQASPPVAHSAGGDVPPLTPSVVGQPLARADKAINNAADAVDAGNGAAAVGPLRATRRYMIRAYRGAKFLIANTPQVPAEDAAVAAASRRYSRAARRAVRRSHRGAPARSSLFTAQASQDDATGPVFADMPTAVFSVLTGQYNTATAAVGMLPDVKGALLQRVQTSLNTAIVLRNRLVKIIHAAAPPAPAEEGRVGAHAAQEEGVTTFDVVMPGLGVLMGDEILQMTATQQDTTVPAASAAVLTTALAADNQILANLNLWWPPVPAED
jgi:hypothetical protein